MGERVSTALDRIESAIARIEAAASRPRSADAALSAKHEALRKAVSESLSELDSLIGGARA